MVQRKLIVLLSLAMAVLLGFADNIMLVCLRNGESVVERDTLTLNEGRDSLVLSSGMRLAVSDIDSIVIGDEALEDSVVHVCWNGTDAPTIQASSRFVSAEVNGGDVVITNTATNAEYTYVLEGECMNGSFTLFCDYKATVRLNGLTLHSTQAEALNIQSGKRINLELADGSVSSLADAQTDNGQKATLRCKGHLEVGGSGILNLSAHAGHAISTKEYMLVKKGAGSINITEAAGDGIHAGQYFQMNGGTLNISGVKGDGIQAEATSDPEDEKNGQLIVKGGSLTITTTGADVAALKSDSLMTVSGGTLVLTTKGSASKALKSKTDVEVSGGNISITQTGSYLVKDMDPSYTTGIKAVNVTLTGGVIGITNTADAGRGISADNSLIINEQKASLVLDVKANGAGGELDVTKNEETGSGDGDAEEEQEAKSYRIFVNVPASTSNRPGGSTSNPWKTVYLYSSNGDRLATLTNSVNVNGKTFYYYDFQKSVEGRFYFGAPNYTSSSGWGGSTSYTIKSSTFNFNNTDGKDRFYQISSTYSTSGSTRTYSISDVTATYGGGAIGGGTVSGDIVSAACLKSDGTVTIAAGTITLTNTGKVAKGITADKDIDILGGTISITNSGAGIAGTSDSFTAKGITSDANVSIREGNVSIRMSGTGGKGIKADANVTIGRENSTAGPVLSVVTTGAVLSGGSGSTSGGGRPGEESGSGAKAIKCVGSYYQYGGDIYIETSGGRAEGIESKTKAAKSMNFNGGNLYMKVHDDCINSAGQICFNGANVICHSTGNDAIDSNYGQNQSIVITAGVVVCFSMPGGAEMGIDADAISRVYLTGGTLISGGGNQGGSSGSSLGSGSTHNKAWSGSISYTTDSYYSVVVGGKNILTWQMPCTMNSSYNIFGSDRFTGSQTHYIYQGTTAPNSGNAHNFRSGAESQPKPMIWEGSNITSGTQKGTFMPN